MLVSTGFAVITPDKMEAVPYYVYLYLTQDSITDYLQSIAEQRVSTYPALNVSDLDSLKINLPPLKEQRAIADTLSALDDKIELNNKINKNLEEQAQAIFKHWFIDFEFPNEEGNPYKSSGGEMVESELGKIPVGWEVTKLNKIADLTMGLSPKSPSYNFDKIGIPLLNGAADFKNGLINTKRYTSAPTRVCKKGDLVFCIRGTIGNITFADKEYCIGRGVASITPRRNVFKGLIYYSLLSSIENLTSKASGSVILGLTKKDINNMKLVLPGTKALNRFSGIANSVIKSKGINKNQNQTLSQLRDTLLPKLMSGEIRVPLAEE